jgi:hypothetical protein
VYLIVVVHSRTLAQQQLQELLLLVLQCSCCSWSRQYERGKQNGRNSNYSHRKNSMMVATGAQDLRPDNLLSGTQDQVLPANIRAVNACMLMCSDCRLLMVVRNAHQQVTLGVQIATAGEGLCTRQNERQAWHEVKMQSNNLNDNSMRTT